VRTDRLRQVAKTFLVSLPPIRTVRTLAALVSACEWRNMRSESARSPPKISQLAGKLLP
jgi:hypothetical protein